MPQLFFRSILCFSLLLSNYSLTWAEDNNKKEFDIGFIGSLTSFAANYGTAVLEGAQLAQEELKEQGIVINLSIEDDQSITKNTNLAYAKLNNINHVKGIIGGSWWINAIVQQSEKDGIPLVSCETLYNEDVVLGKNYFLLQGDLREWINVYEPLIKQEGWKKGAIIRYTSGFGATLAKSMEQIFTKDNREFLGALEYTDVTIPNVTDIILKIKKMQPDVVYFDGQPSNFATFLKKLKEAGLANNVILTNSIAEDVKRDKLIDLTPFKNIYYTKRSAYDQKFMQKFQKKFQKDPYLNADLGYYALHLLAKGLQDQQPIAKIKSGLEIQGHKFNFNQYNVHIGTPQIIKQLQAIEYSYDKK